MREHNRKTNQSNKNLGGSISKMNFSNIKKLILVSAVIALGITSVLAQEGTATLRGTVTDPNGSVVPNATVSVANQETGLNRRTVTTNDTGDYVFSSLRPGLYRVTVEANGFKKAVKSGIRLNVGETQNFGFKIEVGNATEIVTITAEEPLVETSSNKIGGTITEEELIELPSVNRNFIGFVGLVPGVVPNISTESFGSDSVSVNGQDPRFNNFQLDGANNNDDVIGQRAGAQTRTALEAVQEFQVLTNQFDAEFGRTSGGVINAITKSGKNTFNGSAFGFFQESKLDARDRFATLGNLEKPDANRRQFGGTIGGPIKRDLAHFFFSYERTNIDRGVIINIPSRPEFNASTATQVRSDNSLVRIDLQPSDNHQLSARWLRENSPQLNQIIGNVTLSASREEADTDQTLVGSWTYNMSSNLVNDMRINFTREDVAFANPGFNSGTSQADLMPTLAFDTFTTQQNAVAQGRINNSYRIADTLVWVTGAHTVKFGGSFNYLEANNNNEGNLNGTFFFPTDLPFDAANPFTYPERFSIRVGGASTFLAVGKFYSGFAQDSWRITPNLTLNLGVRYDNESISSDNNNFSPRLGFAYDPKGDGKTVIRGGGGLFYQGTQFSLTNAFTTDQPFATSFNRAFPINGRDENPRLGLLPTDPTLVNGPVVNRALVNAIVGTGNLIPNTTPTIDNSDRKMAYTRTFSLGIQRELVSNLAVTVDFIHTNGIDQFITVSLNPQRRTNTTNGARSRIHATLGAAIAASPFPLITAPFAGLPFAGLATTNPRTRTNLGSTRYDALQFTLNKRFSKGYQFKTSYTLSRATGNINGSLFAGANFQTQTGLGLEEQEGVTSFNRKHNFVVSGIYRVPHTKGLMISTIVRALSGSAITIFDGNLDTNQNGINFDPSDASGTFTNSRTYANGETLTFTADNAGGINGANNPGFFQIDLRLAYKFNVSERVNTGFTFELFNIANRANFNGVTGRTNSGNFLIPRTTQTARRVQLGFRVAF